MISINQSIRREIQIAYNSQSPRSRAEFLPLRIVMRLSCVRNKKNWKTNNRDKAEFLYFGDSTGQPTTDPGNVTARRIPLLPTVECEGGRLGRDKTVINQASRRPIAAGRLCAASRTRHTRKFSRGPWELVESFSFVLGRRRRRCCPCHARGDQRRI